MPIKYLYKKSRAKAKPKNVFQNLFHISSLLAAIHLFFSSHDEIANFCSMDKKLVAVTCCIYVLIQLCKQHCAFKIYLFNPNKKSILQCVFPLKSGIYTSILLEKENYFEYLDYVAALCNWSSFSC